MPEDMPRERRMEITGESMNSSEITATFSAIDLTDVYDFLEKSFMLTDIVDLPSIPCLRISFAELTRLSF